MWLGARRDGHALLRAMAYPAMGVLLLTLVLAYSRGALVALAAGLCCGSATCRCACAAPRCCSSAPCAAGAGGRMDFSTHGAQLRRSRARRNGSAPGTSSARCCSRWCSRLRSPGIAISFFIDRRAAVADRAPSRGRATAGTDRRRGDRLRRALAASHRGFTGSISHAVDALTNPNAAAAQHPRSADRHGERARPLLEGGAAGVRRPPRARSRRKGYATARLRYRTEARWSFARARLHRADARRPRARRACWWRSRCCSAWMAAAGARPTRQSLLAWRGWRTRQRTQSGAGLAQLAAAVHARADRHAHACSAWWSCSACTRWSTGPGTCPATRAWRCSAPAGWPGRGPLAPGPRCSATPARRAAPSCRAARPALARLGPRIGCRRVGLAAVAVIAALLAAWSQWQPQRSEEAREAGARARGASDPRAALARAAERPSSRDPLSRRSAVHARRRRAGGRPAGARPRDARARGAPAAVEPADVARTRALRPAASTRGGALQGAAGAPIYLTPSRSPRKRSPRAAARPKRSKSTTSTSRRCGDAPRCTGSGAQKRDADRAREQQPARAGRPAERCRTSTLLEAEVLEQLG